MNAEAELLGPVLTVCLTLIVTGMLIVAGLRAKRGSKVVDDGPLDEPYRVYTRSFDCELQAFEVESRLIKLSPDSARGHFEYRRNVWRGAADRAEVLLAQATTDFLAKSDRLPADLSEVAVALLVDQSGSMNGDKIAWVAASAKLAADELIRRGAIVEVLGFSTAGWQGGYARLKWMADRRPVRPGRLAALLHVVYKPGETQALSMSDWRVMLDPNLLRENIDGEAIEWAAGRLQAIKKSQRVLIVVSDGAPVDDSTLMENGPSYLTRDIERRIARIRAEGRVILAAIGVGYPVEEYYGSSLSRWTSDPDGVPDALLDMLAAILRSVREVDGQ